MAQHIVGVVDYLRQFTLYINYYQLCVLYRNHKSVLLSNANVVKKRQISFIKYLNR